MTSLFPSLFEAVVFWGNPRSLGACLPDLGCQAFEKKGERRQDFLPLNALAIGSRDSNRIRAHRRASELAVLSGRNTICRWKLFRALVNVAFGPLNYIGRLSNQPSSKSVHQG